MGEIIRHKARRVIRGFEQRRGIDYDEVFVAVVKPAVFRPIFALAAVYDLEVEQIDIKTAFLYKKIEETIYVETLTGYGKEGKVCRLKKGLYRLKQAPRIWYNTLHDFLVGQGFYRTNADHSVFVTGAGIEGLVVTIYVDDLKIIGKDRRAIQTLKDALKERFDITDLGPVSYYLGMSVTRDRLASTITLSTPCYILTRFVGGRVSAKVTGEGMGESDRQEEQTKRVCHHEAKRKERALVVDFEF